AFVACMFLVVRPMLRQFLQREHEKKVPLSPLAISGTFVAVLLAAGAAGAVGIHAVVGPVPLRAVVPHAYPVAHYVCPQLKYMVTALLLRPSFAFTGMRTDIGLVSGWENWLWCGAIIVVATAGKFGGSAAAARLTGLGWRDSAAIGTLMNTRGLMELIVLN